MTYPVDTQEGVLEAVNYLLSGPTSLGQTFEGISAVGEPSPIGTFGADPQTYFTGNFTEPYTEIGYPANFWPGWSTGPYGPYTISNITSAFAVGQEQVFTVTLAAPGQPLFYPGQLITLTGVTPADFDTTYVVVDTVPTYPSFSPTTDLIVKPRVGFDPVPVYTSGGEVVVDLTGTFRPTDCSAVVTVTGPTDRVFLNNQTTMTLGYWQLASTVGDVKPTIVLAIRRYRAVQASTVNEIFNTEDTRYYQGFEWQLDGTPLSVPRLITQNAVGGFYEEGLGTNTFINVIDSPGIGHYWYIFEAKVDWGGAPSTDFAPDYLITQDLRSFTAQVIKR